MTTLELNAELYRAMGEIANDETLLAKVLKYVKDLTPAKKAKADADWQISLRALGKIIAQLTRLSTISTKQEPLTAVT